MNIRTSSSCIPAARLRSAALATGLLAACVCAAEPGARAQSYGQDFESRHSGTFGGEKVDYLARFEGLPIRNEAGEEIARIHATSYVRENVSEAAERPVIFIWNGGPSAASQPLHMAGFGPRRLVVPLDVGAPIEAPFEAADNPHTVLDVADLVFVDPVETGFSRILPAGDPAWFYSADGDAQSVAQFIRNWLTVHGRPKSPAFVMGTSYGTIRAALVAGILAGTDTPLEGAFLFSQGVNLIETTQRNRNLVGYATNLSQEAAIAWFHGRTAFQHRPVAEVIDAAQEFAMGDYLVALGKGRQLPDAERQAIAERLADFTGIPAGYYVEHSLRIKKTQFRRELLKDRGLVLGAADARYTAAADAKQGPASPTQGVGEVHRAHLRDFLGVTFDPAEYRPMAPVAFGDWDWNGTTTLDGSKAPPGTKSHIFADFDYPAALVPAFAAKETFRIMFATGIHDLLTTVGPARLLANDFDYPAGRIVLREYAGGHAFYSNDAEFERLADDLREFVKGR